MAKTMSNEVKSNLELAVSTYGSNKKQESSLKKLLEKDSAFIKTTLAEYNLDSFASDSYIAKCSTSKSESFDEELLIGVLKELGIADSIVYTKEHVNYDALENALYNNLLNPEALIPCKIVKTTQRLTIKEIKKE